MPPDPTRRRNVLVTGAAGGLGAATVDRFRAGGWHVIAADLRLPPSGAGVDAVSIDVTDEEAVAAAIGEVEDRCPHGLDAVVTFAGVTGIGPLMDQSGSAIGRVLDVNVLGTHRTVRACWPLLRRAHGRVVLIGSESGWQRALPMNGAYAMSKHAIEAYADALRRELMFADVGVVLVQPGPFRTGMTGGIVAAFDAVAADSPFKPLAVAAGARVEQEDARAADPSILADAVFEATTTPDPRHRYSVRPHTGRVLLHRLPVRVVDRLLHVALRRSAR